MPRAGEGGDEAVGQEGVEKANVEPEEVAPWEMVTREALPEVDAEKRVEEVALQPAVRCYLELEDLWLYKEETWLEVVGVDIPDEDPWVWTLNVRAVARHRLCRCPGTESMSVNARGAAYAPKFLHRRRRRTLPRSRDSSRLRLALRCGTRIAPQPPSPQTRRHNPQKPWPMLRPRRSTYALKLPAYAKLAPRKGDARHLVYLDLDVKIGVLRPEMLELGA